MASHTTSNRKRRASNAEVRSMPVLNLAAFNYDPMVAYNAHPKVLLAKMDVVCRFCNALKWLGEAPGMCCSNGKVKLLPLTAPPEPLKSFMSGASDVSKHFLNSIRSYNSVFQMTSFGAKEIREKGYMPTFKVQGQVYHSYGSLLPESGSRPQFLQIYFLGDDDAELNHRCSIFSKTVKRSIVGELQNFLHNNHAYVSIFKMALERMIDEDHKVVIRPDKMPVAAHRGRFNAPTFNEVAVLIEGNEFSKRDIVLHKKNNTLQRVSDTHRSYDALQYPLIFWQGEDGYCINISQVNPLTGQSSPKKVSAQDFYAFRLMVRCNEENHILKCRMLCHQFLVDMYAKIESERLSFIKFNQPKLRSEYYLNLRDALSNEEDPHDLGRRVILPSTVIGSPRHMHEYTQDAMTYVMFNAHINVEWCHSIRSIKYICKYINKGSDQAVFEVIGDQQIVNEVEAYQHGRYICANEAVWRILGFAIHERYPTVLHLRVHLENGQRVYFNPNTVNHQTLMPPKTTLTSFFELCQQDSFAKTILYSEVSHYYTWNAAQKTFQRRKQGTAVEGHPGIKTTDALGRIYVVHPSSGECFYLRMLLFVVRGPTSFEHLKTVDGVVCQTFREACDRRGMLESDNHVEFAMQEATATQLPIRLRHLFAILLTSEAISQPMKIWEKYRKEMCEDILNNWQTLCPEVRIDYSENIYNIGLRELDKLCLSMKDKHVYQFGLPKPPIDNNNNNDVCQELCIEMNYERETLTAIVETREPVLMADQKLVYEFIFEQLNKGNGGFMFLDAPGGTGKTFLINLILAKIRLQSKIALAVASSGIAATLLDGGRTAHSALKLPLNLDNGEVNICNISKGSGIAKLLEKCVIIIWDECTMAHKKALEILDTTLKDIRNNQFLFGGVLVLLAGDFRQTLPVIPKGTRADELHACLKSSFLWRHVHTLRLTTNMRVQMAEDTTANNFAAQLLKLGNGKIPLSRETGKIQLPTEFCSIVSSTSQLIDRIFPNICQNIKNFNWIAERAILAPTNDSVGNINLKIQDQFPGASKSYYSIDVMLKEDDAVHYPVEFLNSFNPPGCPSHKLELKVGSPIILMRNIHSPKLCNGTRLIIKSLQKNLIEAAILTGCGKGEIIFIPRIPIVPNNLPFRFKRIQFPVRLAFSMTINKAQGQSLKVVGVNLEQPCFSHGQLYVACSRVGSPKNLYIFAPNGETNNIVYYEALS